MKNLRVRFDEALLMKTNLSMKENETVVRQLGLCQSLDLLSVNLSLPITVKRNSCISN